MVNASDVQKLRELTSAGVMDCKKALEEAKGDFDRALSLIKEKGLLIAEKKASRAANTGIVVAYVHNDRIGVLLEIHCETDFVGRSDPFKELAHNIVMQIAAMDPADVPALLEQPFIRNEKTTINDLIKETIAKVGENITIERFMRYEL
ncbi:MAG: translation elongation factor Ts [Patescibacteria group bacterium]|nr:translation elongation factor Ts [Patescibacteria group bacterium]MDE2144563.1 translation elongation factor Ts [Patescibacteria group bacterium]